MGQGRKDNILVVDHVMLS